MTGQALVAASLAARREDLPWPAVERALDGDGWAGGDFSGGEFVLVEQKPRSQSRATVVPLSLGHAVIFAVHHRPARGSKGVYRAALRHGVSTVRDGARFTLGVMFHDAV